MSTSVMTAAPQSSAGESGPMRTPRARVAYIMSRFPQLSETFVLTEMLALEESNVAVEVFPLLRGTAKVMHSEAQRYVERAHYLPHLSPAILGALWYWLLRRPGALLSLWAEVLGGTLGSMNYFFGALGVLPKAALQARRMQELGVTHVHAHFANHPAVAALAIHRLTGIPFSFTVHAHDLYVDQHLLRTKVAAASSVIAISEYNRQFIMRECGEALSRNVVVVHCGVDTDLFTPPVTDGPRRDGALRILCVGSLVEKKGQRHLVDACQQLAARGIAVECQLVGDGPARTALEAQVASLGLGDVVTFAGGQPRDAVRAMLGTADVMVLPSIVTRAGNMEGIPVALMEAMACGVPVISTRTSGIPELINDGVDGFLVPPADAATLADRLAVLADDPARRQDMGARGRAKIVRDFDLRKNVQALTETLVPE